VAAPSVDRLEPGRLQGGLRRVGSATAEQAVASGFLGGWRVVRALPEERALRLFERVADRLHARDGRSVRQLRENLRRVRPDLDAGGIDALTHHAVRSYLRYWCESFRLPAWPREDLVARTRTVHEERLRTPYGEGRGVVVPLPHQANWDWAGAWACGTGMPLMTVAERLRPERLYDEFVAFRAGLGMRILPLSGDRPPMPRLAKYLRQGGFVCLLADRDLSRTAVDVTLCGEAARRPAGPAVLAQQTGAALVPATLRYVGRDLEIRFHEEVAVAPGAEGVSAASQRIADAFTVGIREAPEDWHMMQRVFTDDPGVAR
jgi:phosphatidylinositol dimannoside acyltransferase